MKKFITIVGLLTVLATPAFAQSYANDFGTGNVINEPALEQSTSANATAATAATAAYAMAPQHQTDRNSAIENRYSPAENGGGSLGYNWDLENDR
jgi:opacity protein-like surface antigen